MPDAPEAKVRARAAEMGFSAAAANTKVAQLSGGEKARLLLGLAAFHGPHMLILDEPTNHLDIEARAALISAVNDFPGAVVLVSHDRHLLDACAERLWLVADGTVKPYDGDLDQYRREVLGRAGASRMNGKGDKGEKPKEARKHSERSEAERAELKALKKRLKELEAEIERFEREIEKLDKALADATLHAENPAKAANLGKERSDSALNLARLEEEWLAASAHDEALRAN
jgi:ATP-binding cassette subfamily F protein 3